MRLADAHTHHAFASRLRPPRALRHLDQHADDFRQHWSEVQAEETNASSDSQIEKVAGTD